MRARCWRQSKKTWRNAPALKAGWNCKEIAADLAPLDELRQRLDADAEDLEARYGVAIHAAVAEDFETALDYCLAIVQADRKFRDDIGRLTMLKLFDVLGKGDALAGNYRRRLFAFLH